MSQAVQIEDDKSLEDAGNKCSNFCAGEKQFIPYKAHYFLLNGAHVGVVPYLPVYAKAALGCSATTVGLLATCMQFSTTISKPLFGLLADCLNRMKLLIACLLLLEVVLNLLMLALPPVDLISNQLPFHTESKVLSDEGSEKSKESYSILRFAPARVYDISVGLHLQPRNLVYEDAVIRPEPYTNSFGLIPNLNSSKIFYPDLDSLENWSLATQIDENYNSILVKERTRKCKVNCGVSIPEAVCYQPYRKCIDPQAVNILSCTHTNTSNFSFCDNFHGNANFSLAYHIKKHHSQSDHRMSSSLDLLSHSFMYYKKSHKSWKKVSCNDTSVHCSMKCEHVTKFCAQKVDESRLYRTYQFWTFCIFALIGSMCQGALYTLSDTACYEKIRGTKSNFGMQRLWGAMGWGIVAPLIGFLNDLVTGNSIHEDYSSGWYVMAILSLFFMVNLYYMGFPPSRQSENMCDAVKKITTSRHFILMEINVFFLGILNAYATNYVIWYMEILGSSRTQMGLALAVDCLFGEAPFMYISGWLISRLGHWHIVTLSFAAFGARFGAYYLITDPWMVLPVELLHGITFGLVYTTITSYGEFVSSSGTEATIQGILGGIYQGLGSGVGCLVAGISFDRYGGQRSFLLVAIFSSSLALCHAAVHLLCKPFKKEQQILNEDCK